MTLADFYVQLPALAQAKALAQADVKALALASLSDIEPRVFIMKSLPSISLLRKQVDALDGATEEGRNKIVTVLQTAIRVGMQRVVSQQELAGLLFTRWQ